MAGKAGSPVSQAEIRERLSALYAAGGLEPAMRLLVETQAQLAPIAAAELAAADALAAALFERQEPVAMSAGALEKTFARLAAEPEERGPGAAMRAAARRAASVIDEILHLPNAVQDAALAAIGRGGWTFAGPGMRILPLEIDSACRAEIIRIEPGWGAPRHSHGGGEYTLVMTGAFADERGRYFVGDIAYAGPGDVHRPTAEKGDVCYSLAVSEAPMEFTGPLGLLQKLWRH